MPNLSLTKEQFEKLVDLVTLGDWVVNSGEPQPSNEYTKLYEYIFSKCKDFDLAHITYPENPESPNPEYIGRLIKTYMEEYNQRTFWEQLADNLTQKYLSEKYTEEEINQFDKDAFIQLYVEAGDKVRQHLTNHGIDQIVIT